MAPPRDEETPLVAAAEDDSPAEKGRSHTRDVHILSSAFLLVFLAYGAAQNLESTVNNVSSIFEYRIGKNTVEKF